MPLHRRIEHRLSQAAFTLTVEPLDNSVDIYECFDRVKNRQSLDKLLQERDSLLVEQVRVREQVQTLSRRVLLEGIPLEDLQEAQQVLNQELPELLSAINEEIEAAGERMSGDTEKELDDIRNMPRVIDVQALNEHVIMFTILATIDYVGTEYHLGTWNLYVGNFDPENTGKPVMQKGHSDGNYFRVLRVVETRLVNKVNCYPIYDREDGSFCFGSTQACLIDRHIVAGRIRDAVHVATVGLCTITGNHDVYNKIPEYFAVYEPKGRS